MSNFDSNSLTMSRALLDDFKKYAGRDRTKEIIELLESKLDPNFDEAIKLIKETYGIED